MIIFAKYLQLHSMMPFIIGLITLPHPKSRYLSEFLFFGARGDGGRGAPIRTYCGGKKGEPEAAEGVRIAPLFLLGWAQVCPLGVSQKCAGESSFLRRRSVERLSRFRLPIVARSDAGPFCVLGNLARQNRLIARERMQVKVARSAALGQPVQRPGLILRQPEPAVAAIAEALFGDGNQHRLNVGHPLLRPV